MPSVLFSSPQMKRLMSAIQKDVLKPNIVIQTQVPTLSNRELLEFRTNGTDEETGLATIGIGEPAPQKIADDASDRVDAGQNAGVVAQFGGSKLWREIRVTGSHKMRGKTESKRRV